jgi:hypothetical protein
MTEANVNFSKDLDCPLTQEEWEERSKMQGDAVRDWETAQAAAKLSAKQHGEVVRKAEGRVHDLARAVRDRKESRAVLCEERVNNRLFRVETVRLDTSEIIDARPMTDEEMAEAQQGRLFTEKASGSQKKTKAEKAEAKARADAAATEPGDSHTLPEHPVLETSVRAPEESIPCPGPGDVVHLAEGQKSNCTGEDCSRCAGLLFIPNPDYSPPTGGEVPAAPESDDEGTAIVAPEAVLAGQAGPDDGGKPKGRGMRRVVTAGASH